MSAAILVVEDNPDNMKLFQWTLEDAGYDFTGVGTAEEGLALLEERSQIEAFVQLEETAGEHARRRTNRVVPVDFAEHHVPGKDHHLRRRFAFACDRQPRPRLVQAQTANQPQRVKVSAVRNTGVQAVPRQVIHLVDIDRSGK